MPTYVRKTADISVSQELQVILRMMEKNSEIAQMLLKQRHPVDSLVDGYVNYICISKSDKTKISYLTQDRENSVNGDHWHSSKRFNAKPGAFIRKVFTGLSDRQVEIFSTLFKNIQSSPDFTMRVVEGNDIIKYYFYETYAEQTSSLGASCMKHGDCQDFLNLYADNPETIKMLIMVNRDGRLVGRSILWDIEPNKIMDRIYTINDDEYSYQFKKWADDNGYWYKKEQKWNNTLFFESKGNPILSEMSIVLKNTNYRRYPYLDTFKFFDPDSKIFYNYIPKDKEIYTLSTTDGTKQTSDYLARDGKTDLFHYKNETIWLEYKGYRTHQNNLFYSDVNDKYILKEDALYNEELGDYIFIDDSLNDKSRIQSRLDYITRKKEEIKKSIHVRTNPLDGISFPSYFSDAVINFR
jgi:hypothetical protein